MSNNEMIDDIIDKAYKFVSKCYCDIEWNCSKFKILKMDHAI